VTALRRCLEDVERAPLVEEFLAIHARSVRPDSLQHIRAHLRYLILEGGSLPRSQATPEYLQRLLYDLPGKRNTLRKIHSSWSVFFDYLTNDRAQYDRSPMERVRRPDLEQSPIRYYEMDDVERISGAQPSLERRALFALFIRDRHRGERRTISQTIRRMAG
jgi:hypothetical protein